MFFFHLPDFPTPSFPNTTDRMLFMFELLFTERVRGLVAISKFAGKVKQSIDLSWK